MTDFYSMEKFRKFCPVPNFALMEVASVGRPDILLGAYVYFVNNSVSIAVVTT